MISYSVLRPGPPGLRTYLSTVVTTGRIPLQPWSGSSATTPSASLSGSTGHQHQPCLAVPGGGKKEHLVIVPTPRVATIPLHVQNAIVAVDRKISTTYGIAMLKSRDSGVLL